MEIRKGDRAPFRIGPEYQGSCDVPDFLHDREWQSLDKPAEELYKQPFYPIPNAFHSLFEIILPGGDLSSLLGSESAWHISVARQPMRQRVRIDNRSPSVVQLKLGTVTDRN